MRPKLRCLLRDGRVRWGGHRGSTSVFGMALAAALTLLMALLPAGLAFKNNSESQKVTCTEGASSPQQKDVTAAGTVLTVECPGSLELDPPFKKEKPEVFKTDACTEPVPLTQIYADAKVEAVDESKSKMTITFGTLPETTRTFCLRCQKKDDHAKCDVKVILHQSATTPPGPQPPSGSGTPSVQTCKANSSITLQILEKGSSALFACESGFDLYPTEPDKVFSKDCKKKETLSDMTRTDTPASGKATGAFSPPSQTYTLKAEKKPSKKTLCYLCAKHEITAEPPGTAADYCTIYVESGARTQFDLVFTFVLVLSCVLAAVQFT